MLVVMMDNQLLAPDAICQSCLMANQAGQPRWRQGRLCCGRLLADSSAEQPAQYECQMGFRIAHIE
ncbi:hypothetical protein [Leptolyngbya sp. PCC 6406]|uniref:hypothetical protein n=1 Tax=Leptolyngbya sp. PCC 6406 TaxID=1173264 RepID=UPI0002AC9452|nr:hypothetical protein [Leptolyngbya sp. PCC 6406]